MWSGAFLRLECKFKMQIHIHASKSPKSLCTSLGNINMHSTHWLALRGSFGGCYSLYDCLESVFLQNAVASGSGV